MEIPADNLESLQDFYSKLFGRKYRKMAKTSRITSSITVGSSPVRGMHGYHPEDPDSDTVLIADPAPDPAPQEITDLVGVLLSDAGIEGEAT